VHFSFFQGVFASPVHVLSDSTFMLVRKYVELLRLLLAPIIDEQPGGNSSARFSQLRRDVETVARNTNEPPIPVTYIVAVAAVADLLRRVCALQPGLVENAADAQGRGSAMARRRRRSERVVTTEDEDEDAALVVQADPEVGSRTDENSAAILSVGKFLQSRVSVSLWPRWRRRRRLPRPSRLVAPHACPKLMMYSEANNVCAMDMLRQRARVCPRRPRVAKRALRSSSRCCSAATQGGSAALRVATLASSGGREALPAERATSSSLLPSSL